MSAEPAPDELHSRWRELVGTRRPRAASERPCRLAWQENCFARVLLGNADGRHLLHLRGKLP